MANWVVPVINRINEIKHTQDSRRVSSHTVVEDWPEPAPCRLVVCRWRRSSRKHLQISVYSLILDVIVYSLFILHDLCSCGCMYCDMGTCNIYNISCDATILVHLLVFANYQIYHMTVFSYPYRTI